MVVQICRAEDGHVSQLNTTLYDLSKNPASFRNVLSQVTSYGVNNIIAFLSDGQQLREDNLRELSGAQDQSIFVFNREYLDLELESAAALLNVPPTAGLLPPISPSGSNAPSSSNIQQEDSIMSNLPSHQRSSSSSFSTNKPSFSELLQNYLQQAQQHQSYVSSVLQQIHNQHEALAIASSNLDMHVLTLVDAWSGSGNMSGSLIQDSATNGIKSTTSAGGGGVEESVWASLETQARLLEGIDADLDAISRIQVHPQFLAVAQEMSKAKSKENTAASSKETESATSTKDDAQSSKAKALGEYVSHPKMRLVVESCRRLHNQLLARFRAAQSEMLSLRKGAEEVRKAVIDDVAMQDSATNKIVGVRAEAARCTKSSQDILESLETEINAWQEGPIEPADRDLEGAQTWGKHVGDNTWSEEEEDQMLAEVKEMDSRMRQEVQRIGQVKNEHTLHLLKILRNISTLQSSIASLPAALNTLESDLRRKDGFAHLQRLHGMAFAYGASVVEVVRRREFGRFFMERAQAMAEIMAKFSASERKRRQVYRGESLSLLPFDTSGMDLPAPSIEISATGTDEGPYLLERADVDVDLSNTLHRKALLEDIRRIEELDDRAAGDGQTDSPPHPLRETREALEKLIAKMDHLETDFDRFAEKSILSASRLSYYKRRSVNEAIAFNEAAEQLRELQGVKEAQDQAFAEERASFQAQIQSLRNENRSLADSQLPHLEGTITHLEELLRQARNSVEQAHTKYDEARARNNTYEQDLRQRNSEISKLIDQLDQEERSRRALELERGKWGDMDKALHEEIQLAKHNLDSRLEAMEGLERDNAIMAEENRLLRERDEASRQKIEALERQLRQAKAEGEDAKSALVETMKDRDRLLRDHQVEADGDRAVLEHRFLETKSQLETVRSQVQEAQEKAANATSQYAVVQAQNNLLHEDLAALRKDLRKTNVDLTTAVQGEMAARQKENSLQAELNFANNALVQIEGRMERIERILAQVFDVAIAFRNSHAKALTQAQTMLRPVALKGTTTAATANNNGVAGLAESMVLTPGLPEINIGSPPRQIMPGSLPMHSMVTLPPATERPSSPTPIDPSDPLAALDTLREFDLDAFAETIAKVGTTIRKWQKQCKEYRERAKGRISFRNFQKGDLALFLPTRNPVARPWAAFNMSFPHYFLNATGPIAEQLKTREWIVARITSITERVVDSKEPTSNPYGLGNGVKYYMLEVEDWSLNTPVTSVRNKPQRSVSNPKPTNQIEPAKDVTPSQSVAIPSLTLLKPKQQEDPDILEGITAIPTRPRAATASSTGAGPSSLSKLLAQATKDTSPAEEKPSLRTVMSTNEQRPSLPEKDTGVSGISSIPPTPDEIPLPEVKDKLEKATVPVKVQSPIAITPPNNPPVSSISPPTQLRLTPRESPKPSPRQRPSPLQVAGTSPRATTSIVNATASTTNGTPAININRRMASARSSMSSTRPTSVLRRPPFALSSSPAKASATTQVVTDAMSSSTALPNSPFRVSSEDLEGDSRIEEIQETPSPADSATEGVNSMLVAHARRRTTSTITPATVALNQTVGRNNPDLHQPSSPSPLSGVWNVFNPWKKKRPESMLISDSEGGSGRRSLSLSQSVRERRMTASEVGGAAGLLKKFEPRE